LTGDKKYLMTFLFFGLFLVLFTDHSFSEKVNRLKNRLNVNTVLSVGKQWN